MAKTKQLIDANVNIQPGERNYGPIALADGTIGFGTSFFLRQDIPEGRFIYVRVRLTSDGGLTYPWIGEWSHARPSIIDYPDGTLIEFERNFIWENITPVNLVADVRVIALTQVRIDLSVELVT